MNARFYQLSCYCRKGIKHISCVQAQEEAHMNWAASQRQPVAASNTYGQGQPPGPSQLYGPGQTFGQQTDGRAFRQAPSDSMLPPPLQQPQSHLTWQQHQQQHMPSWRPPSAPQYPLDTQQYQALSEAARQHDLQRLLQQHVQRGTSLQPSAAYPQARLPLNDRETRPIYPQISGQSARLSFSTPILCFVLC